MKNYHLNSAAVIYIYNRHLSDYNLVSVPITCNKAALTNFSTGIAFTLFNV